VAWGSSATVAAARSAANWLDTTGADDVLMLREPAVEGQAEVHTFCRLAHFFDHKPNSTPQSQHLAGKACQWVVARSFALAAPSPASANATDSTSGEPVYTLRATWELYPVSAIKRHVSFYHCCTLGSSSTHCKLVATNEGGDQLQHALTGAGDRYLLNEHAHTAHRNDYA
jgi:hypothetical protein